MTNGDKNNTSDERSMMIVASEKTSQTDALMMSAIAHKEVVPE